MNIIKIMLRKQWQVSMQSKKTLQIYLLCNGKKLTSWKIVLKIYKKAGKSIQTF